VLATTLARSPVVLARTRSAVMMLLTAKQEKFVCISEAQGSPHFILLNSDVLSNVYLLGKICTMDTVLRHHSLKLIGADASAEMQSG